MEMFILADFTEWLIYPLATLAVLNFILNMASVYLGLYKRRNHGAMLEHILSHICPEYSEDMEEEDFESIGFAITPEMAQDIDSWMKFAQNHIAEHGRFPNQQDIDAHFNKTDNSEEIKNWDEA
jgi:hypothetical protein